MPAELHLLHLARIARPVAHLARNIDVREEVHLDLDDPVPLTVLAPTAPHIEAEAARLVAAHLRLGKLREEVAHVREHAGVRRGIRPRRAPDRRLVDVDRLVEVLEPLHRVVCARPVLGPIEVLTDLAPPHVPAPTGFPPTPP